MIPFFKIPDLVCHVNTLQQQHLFGEMEGTSAVWLQLKSCYMNGRSTGVNHHFGNIYSVVIAKLSVVISCSWFIAHSLGTASNDCFLVACKSCSLFL